MRRLVGHQLFKLHDWALWEIAFLQVKDHLVVDHKLVSYDHRLKVEVEL